eukprot:12821751-Heterocapsa_arctica.AAC.1
MSFRAVVCCVLPQRVIDVFPRRGVLCAPATHYICLSVLRRAVRSRNALYMPFRAAASCALPQRVIDVFPLASAC